MDKNEIRSKMIKLRLDLSQEEVMKGSAEINKKILELDAYKKAESVLVYMSIRNEVRLDMVIERALKDGKSVYIPKVYQDRRMEFYLYDGELSEGAFGILEPKDVSDQKKFDIERIRDDGGLHNILVIEPGVAFDKAGNRLGYGGGYYDTFLSRVMGEDCFSVGVGYDFQIVEKIPVDEYDIKPDIIITN